LTSIDKRFWQYLLEKWYQKWKDYLKEKTIDSVTGKWHYTHKRLRSAYRSLKTNNPTFLLFKNIQNLIFPTQLIHWMDLSVI